MCPQPTVQRETFLLVVLLVVHLELPGWYSSVDQLPRIESGVASDLACSFS